MPFFFLYTYIHSFKILFSIMVYSRRLCYLYMHTNIHICIFFIYLSVCGYLGGFRVLAIINRAVFSTCLVVGLLVHMAIIFLVF